MPVIPPPCAAANWSRRPARRHWAGDTASADDRARSAKAGPSAPRPRRRARRRASRSAGRLASSDRMLVRGCAELRAAARDGIDAQACATIGRADRTTRPGRRSGRSGSEDDQGVLEHICAWRPSLLRCRPTSTGGCSRSRVTRRGSASVISSRQPLAWARHLARLRHMAGEHEREAAERVDILLDFGQPRIDRSRRRPRVRRARRRPRRRRRAGPASPPAPRHARPRSRRRSPRPDPRS